jgi:hypothetical protein
MLKMQFYFLMNRVSVLFLALTTLLLCGVMLYASRFFEGYTVLDLSRATLRTEYVIEGVGISKFVLVATALFLNIHCFWAGNGKYSAFFVSAKKQRISFIVSKLMMVNFIILFMALNAWILFSLIGTWLTPYYEIDWKEVWYFSMIALEAIGFGLAQAILMQMLDSIFTGIVLLALFWFLEVNSNAGIETAEIIAIMYRIVPHLLTKETEFTVGGDLFSYLLFIVALFVMNIAIFATRDIK